MQAPWLVVLVQAGLTGVAAAIAAGASAGTAGYGAASAMLGGAAVVLPQAWYAWAVGRTKAANATAEAYGLLLRWFAKVALISALAVAGFLVGVQAAAFLGGFVAALVGQLLAPALIGRGRATERRGSPRKNKASDNPGHRSGA